ncbi:MAG: hypothetical protein ABI268_00620 [Rhodanobacter sp.]
MAMAADSTKANSGANTFPCQAPNVAVANTNTTKAMINRRSPRLLSARLGLSHKVARGKPTLVGRSTIMGIRRACNAGMIGRGDPASKIVARD